MNFRLTDVFVTVTCVLAAGMTTDVVRADVRVTPEPFGTTADGVAVEKFVIENDHGLRVELIEYGATIQKLWTLDDQGELADIVLGFDDLAGYESPDNPFFGCTVGRYANRIAHGRFTLDDQTYELAQNNNGHHLHGGEARSLLRVVWNGAIVKKKSGAGVEFTYISPDGEEGYPGELTVTASFFVPDADKNILRLDYTVTTTKPTVINLTSHSYFNLHGGAPGGVGTTIKDHLVRINAEMMTPTGDDFIPTGAIEPVDGTPYDFRVPTAVGEQLLQAGFPTSVGYDLNYVLKEPRKDNPMRLAGKIIDPVSGREVVIRTTEPGVQFYTTNEKPSRPGKNNTAYPQYGGLCLETQHFPDSPNQPSFPSTVLRPGETFESTTTIGFRIRKRLK